MSQVRSLAGDRRHPYKQISTPVRRIGAATALANALLVLRARTPVIAPRAAVTAKRLKIFNTSVNGNSREGDSGFAKRYGRTR